MEDSKELCEACNGKGVLNEINGFTFGDVICPICVNKEKQETLEEAAKRTEFERYGKTLTNYTKQRPAYNLGFNNGAKWQAENMPIHILDADNIYVYIKGGVVIVEKNDKSKVSFSEEDMIKAAKYGYDFHKTTQFPNQDFEDSCIRNMQQWLKTFKKK